MFIIFPAVSVSQSFDENPAEALGKPIATRPITAFKTYTA